MSAIFGTEWKQRSTTVNFIPKWLQNLFSKQKETSFSTYSPQVPIYKEPTFYMNQQQQYQNYQEQYQKQQYSQPISRYIKPMTITISQLDKSWQKLLKSLNQKILKNLKVFNFLGGMQMLILQIILGSQLVPLTIKKLIVMDVQIYLLQYRNIIQNKQNDCQAARQWDDLCFNSEPIKNAYIYKTPLSQKQWTNLIFNHQFVIVQTANSKYYSFEKITTQIICQISNQIEDVRDNRIGEKRCKKQTVLGELTYDWEPQLIKSKKGNNHDHKLYQYSTGRTEKQKKYNVIFDNCKDYARRVYEKA